MRRPSKEGSREQTLPLELTDTTHFLARVKEIISGAKLLSAEDTDKLLENEALVSRLQEVTQLAHKTLSKPGNKYAKLENTPSALPALQDWEIAVFDFYALSAPAIDITAVPAIMRAEKHTGLKSLSRSPIIWTSQASRFQVEKSSLESPETDRMVALREDIERWFGPAGLLLHTAVASWSIQTTVENLQRYVKSEVPENDRNRWHEYLLRMSSQRARIWLNLHDLGRLVTHDPYLHAVLTHVICEAIGLPRYLYSDYDFPNILEFGSEISLVPEFELPEQMEHEGKTEYTARVNQKRVSYVDSSLELLEKMSEEDDQYENPVSVLVFWLVDAYTKLYDVREERTLASNTGIIDSRKIVEEFGHYANLQPGDEQALFFGRFFYRLKQTCGRDLSGLSSTEVRAYLTDKIETAESEEDKKIYQGELKNYLYYSRQYEFARSIFVWLQEKLGIPNQLLWNLIFEFTQRNDKHLDPNGDFNHHPANPHTDIWKATTKSELARKRAKSLEEISKPVPETYSEFKRLKEIQEK